MDRRIESMARSPPRHRQKHDANTLDLAGLKRCRVRSRKAPKAPTCTRTMDDRD